MAFAINPILRGFNPDPSILRVNEDYYIATSTFEWFPGVQVYHSRDLVHWELICHPLDRLSQINMTGNPCSGGVWAPCLSFCDGRYYLVYTDVKTVFGAFKDTHNYLVTATDIKGPWSDPVYLNSSGFDPSLFHDSDGRKWLVNMLMDYRPFNDDFGGIVIQEYSEKERKLIGSRKVIFRGTGLGCTEGPHLYKYDGYYYLIVAEGGTSYSHAVSAARCRTVDGDYEADPLSPILTARENAALALQKAGHASLVQAHDGSFYLAHLCGRPVGNGRNCILGRETAIQAVEWRDGWLRLKGGGNHPKTAVDIPFATENGGAPADFSEDFDGSCWSLQLQSLRVPLGSAASLTERPGFLRLYGGESPSSRHRQSLLAHRQQHFRFSAQTELEFNPGNFQQMAGLIYYYDSLSYYYLHVTRDEENGRVLNLMCSVLGKMTYPLGRGIAIDSAQTVFLRLCADFGQAQFFYKTNGETYFPAGPVLDATVLSDDYYAKIGEYRFTGAFVGICCQDLSGARGFADFDSLTYHETE